MLTPDVDVSGVLLSAGNNVESMVVSVGEYMSDCSSRVEHMSAFVLVFCMLSLLVACVDSSSNV